MVTPRWVRAVRPGLVNDFLDATQPFHYVEPQPRELLRTAS